jgi:hypothetical protein
MHRNKSKERDFEANGVVDHSIPDAFLSFEKQRNGEWEGVAKLWFDRQSQQYVQEVGGLPTEYQPKTYTHRAALAEIKQDIEDDVLRRSYGTN